MDPFWSKIWPFLLKNQVFGHFLRNRTSDLSKTWSETGDICFESSNGSVMSGKFLVFAVLAIFGSKIHCMWWHLYGFGLFLVIFSKPLMFFGDSLLFELCYWVRNDKWKIKLYQKISATWGNWMGLIPSLTWANAERPQHCALVLFARVKLAK